MIISPVASRRRHASVVPEKVDLIIDGRPIQVKDAAGHLVRPRIGVDPVTEDLLKDWTGKRSVKGWNATVPNPSATESASTRTTIFIWAIWRYQRAGAKCTTE